MKKLIVSIATFGVLVADLIKSGVNFEAKEIEGNIVITFDGGY